MRTFFALTAAILGPALIVIGQYVYGSFQLSFANDGYIWVRIRGFSLITLMVATAYAVLLGLPAFLLLKWKSLVRWWSATGVGFLLGALPIAILAWPLQHPEFKTSASVNGVQTMINGVPTVAGWLQYASAVGFIGALGAIGGICFWLVWRHEPQQSVPADAAAPRTRTPALGLRRHIWKWQK